jgi:hypothetical protein
MLEIVIWISHTDIEDLENSLNRLSKGQLYLSQEQRDNIKFNVVLCISDDIIDWSKSQILKEECITDFLKLKKLIKWANKESTFEPTATINGCTSMRRISSYSDSKWYLWLDTDIIFDPLTLPYMINSIESLNQSEYSKFVITPEIVRIWDETWDCLVNDNFINKPLGYQKLHNPHEDTKINPDLEPTLVEVYNNIPGQPYMKFGGGWFAVVSKELMKSIPFPDNYGHYGLDDTYLMWGAQILQDPSIKQFKIKNIIVSENYFDRNFTYKDQIQFIDRREEYKKINESLFQVNLNKLAISRK